MITVICPIYIWTQGFNHFFRPNLQGYLPKLLIHNRILLTIDASMITGSICSSMFSTWYWTDIKLRMNFKNYLHVWSAFPFKNQVGMHNADKCVAISSLGMGGKLWFKRVYNFYVINNFHSQLQAFNKMISLNFQHTDYQHIDIILRAW